MAQGVYNETPDFSMPYKKKKMFFSDARDLLYTTGPRDLLYTT
jgi:hypothetical protein